MSLNWKEINLILTELDLSGSQIQKVLQPAFDILVLGLYKAGCYKNILISLAPGSCRLHETFKSIPKPERQLRFAEFLKAHIVNSWIDKVEQLGEERIICFTLHRCQEQFFFYVRLWSNAGNIIVTDSMYKILDVMKRKPKRNEVGGVHFEPMPINHTQHSEQLYSEQQSMQSQAEFQDSSSSNGNLTACSNDTKKRIYEVREYPHIISFNKYIDDWYAEHGTALSLEVLQEQVKKVFSSRMGKLEASLVNLEKKIKSAEEAELLKEEADILMANIGSIIPGSAWFQGENFYTGGTIKIKLDPQKTAVQNAEHYYELYRKTKNGLLELQKDYEDSKNELARLEEKKAKLLAIDNPLELYRLLTIEVKNKKNLDKKRPGVAFISNGWMILAGRDASENDELLRRHVKGQDIWLHTRDVPGGYIFIKAKRDKSVPLDVLIDAGNLAVFYSKARNVGEADLYYTFVKYLRRAKNGPKGLVLPTQEKNLHIVLDQNRLRRLEQNKCDS